MTEKEAIKKVKEFGLYHAIGDLPNSALTVKAFKMAVAALEEIQQYRTIGTVEECQEARERQRAKKPIMHKDTNRADCPICGATVRGIKEPFGDWCSKCGQKLYWSETV